MSSDYYDMSRSKHMAVCIVGVKLCELCTLIKGDRYTLWGREVTAHFVRSCALFAWHSHAYGQKSASKSNHIQSQKNF